MGRSVSYCRSLLDEYRSGWCNRCGCWQPLVGRLRGKIDERLARLDAALQHRGFVLQRFAEYELEAIVECWRAARTCLPLINSARPLDSGDGPEAEDTLTSAYSALSNGHNILIENIGRHEPFLPDAIVQTLDTLSQMLRFEMSNIRHHPHFQRHSVDRSSRAPEGICGDMQPIAAGEATNVRVARAGYYGISDRYSDTAMRRTPHSSASLATSLLRRSCARTLLSRVHRGWLDVAPQAPPAVCNGWAPRPAMTGDKPERECGHVHIRDLSRFEWSNFRSQDRDHDSLSASSRSVGSAMRLGFVLGKETHDRHQAR